MGRSFLICRIAGIPIRVHWAFVVLPIFFLYQPLIQIRTHPQGPEWFLLGLTEMVFLVIAVICHEMAHALTARRYGAQVDSIVLWPLGGLTQLSGMPGTPSAQILLSLAGPACNLGLAALGFALARLPGQFGPYAGLFAWWNLLLGGFNLIPAYPMDGGQAVRTALHAKLGHARGDLWAGRIGVAAAVVIIVYGLTQNNVFLMIIGFLTGASSYTLLKQSRFAAYSPRPRVPESGDFRTWRLPKQELEAEIERKRAAERADEQMRRRTDELLTQISEKGIGSLSEEDRAFLKSASERLRARRR